MLRAVGTRNQFTFEAAQRCRPFLATALLMHESVEQAMVDLNIDEYLQRKQNRNQASKKRPRDTNFLTETK